MSVQLIYTMRSLVKSVESTVLLDWSSSRLVSSTSPTSRHPLLHRPHAHGTLRGRDQQPGYFIYLINFTRFTDLSSERLLHRPQLGSRIGYNICMFKFYFNYYKKYVRIVRAQFRRGRDSRRVVPWLSARVIDLFYTLTLAMRRAPHAPS